MKKTSPQEERHKKNRSFSHRIAAENPPTRLQGDRRDRHPSEENPEGYPYPEKKTNLKNQPSGSFP